MTKHHKKHWQQQYDVAFEHIIPWLGECGVDLLLANVLDFGCGEGGISCAMDDWGASCWGFDIDKYRLEIAEGLREDRAVSYSCSFPDGQFDLIVLHDVVEHLETKLETLLMLKERLKSDGRIFIFFPPYGSAYGGHQQHTTLKLPFIHLFHDPKVINGKLGMKSFERMAERAGLTVTNKQVYIIRPEHTRFGLKPVKAGMLACVPVLDELLCSGVYYLLGISDS